MSEPTKPGWWWANHGLYKGAWEIVEVDADLNVWASGLDTQFAISDFTFGPEVTKPEGLE